MTQYGFFIDLSRCIGCNSCAASCLQWNNIGPGNIRWMRVQTWETGAFPNTRNHILPVNCYQCQNPLCLKACKQGALHKEPNFGAVLVDQNKCIGCRKCWDACPYGSPQFASDEPGEKMSKCNMCIDRLEEGLLPICVRSCSMRALDFGPLSELQEKYGDLQAAYDMPSPTRSNPSVVFKPVAGKKQVVPYDSKRALELWQHRSPQAFDQMIFDDAKDITEPDLSIIGRHKLKLKAKTAKEKQYYSTDDD